MSYYKLALEAILKFGKQWPDRAQLYLSIAGSVNDNQMKSKKWLVEELADVLELREIKNPKILLMAGWYGLVGDMMRTKLGAEVTKVDKEALCEPIGREMYPKIKHKWGHMEEWDNFDFDVIVMPSCEHVAQEKLNAFLAKKKDDTIVVLQSNNQWHHEDHINCKGSVHEFANSVKLQIIKEGELEMNSGKDQSYRRFMIFGL